MMDYERCMRDVVAATVTLMVAAQREKGDVEARRFLFDVHKLAMRPRPAAGDTALRDALWELLCL